MAPLNQIVEAPTAGPLAVENLPPERGRDNEPLLDIKEIQGNILPGFLKDYVTLLFLRITDPAAFGNWLGALVPFIATTEEVLAFNRLFKEMRRRRGTECATVQATWVNVALSYQGLVEIRKNFPALDLDFKDQAFRDGLLQRSRKGLLGDPVGTGKEGDPDNWVIGGPGKEAHLVLIVAGDSRSILLEEVARLEQSVFQFTDPRGRPAPSGVDLIFRQDGATLVEPLRGHEHFGFLDGISQPGVRGKVSPRSFLTPDQNPRNRNQGKPGQDLLWPGEFVFGYPGQDATKDVPRPGQDPLLNPARRAPAWARNGSFLVFRRLRQDVGSFHHFLNQVAERFQVPPASVGARLVGRWASGAPVVASPAADDPVLGNDDCRNNNFEFKEEEDAGQEGLASFRDELLAALEGKDGAALEQMTDDEFTLIGPDGQIFKRRPFLDGIANPGLPLPRHRRQQQRWQVPPGGGVVNEFGELVVDGQFANRDVTGSYSYTATFVKAPAGWRLAEATLTKVTQQPEDRQDASKPVPGPAAGALEDCPNVAEPATDPDGANCAFAAHIRKAYPRNDTSDSRPGLSERSSQTHRLLRRGIPYGEASASTPTAPADDQVDRGLLFLCYQVSIEDQFEFVTRECINNPDFKERGAGHDPVIGQNDKAPDRARTFTVHLGGAPRSLTTDREWVIPTGGGYFFAPSLTALANLARGVSPRPAAQPPARRPKRGSGARGDRATGKK